VHLQREAVAGEEGHLAVLQLGAQRAEGRGLELGRGAHLGREGGSVPTQQGLTIAHFRAQLEDLRDTSITLELNLSTSGTHPRVILGYVGDNVRLS